MNRRIVNWQVLLLLMLSGTVPASAQDRWNFRHDGFVISNWGAPTFTDEGLQTFVDNGYNVAKSERNLGGDSAELIRELELCAKYGIDLTVNGHSQKSWGGVASDTSHWHAPSKAEVRWICKTYGSYSAFSGILLHDDSPFANFLQRNDPALLPIPCGSGLCKRQQQQKNKSTP